MPRYFLETFYKGSRYAGFQIQQNANSIQAEIEKSLRIFLKEDFMLTGSSRTDTGVHALSNYFHFDTVLLGDYTPVQLEKMVYNLNAILPGDIVIRKIFAVADTAHCRFDAVSREYHYFIYQHKDPFRADRAYYYPFRLDKKVLDEVAASILLYEDFTSFSKRNTQVKSFQCQIVKSEWTDEGGGLVYKVKGNRFLRGMVRGLVGTMLRAGTGKITVGEFRQIVNGRDSSRANFSVPPQGLFLVGVEF